DTMQRNTKVLNISILVSAVMLLTLSVARAEVVTTQDSNGAETTKITVNGRAAETFLNDPDFNTNGGLTASKDQVANTSALDFSYAFTDPTNPDQVILIQGAGEIPNSAFTITSTTAHLVVTTTSSFLVIRCVINLNTGFFECDPTTPKSFDLTWGVNGFGSTDEK